MCYSIHLRCDVYRLQGSTDAMNLHLACNAVPPCRQIKFCRDCQVTQFSGETDCNDDILAAAKEKSKLICGLEADEIESFVLQGDYSVAVL